MSYKEYTIRIYDNGMRKYFNKAGQRHREDGPAIEWANGSKFWFINDQRHREDGPAIEWADGSKFWWINGRRLTEAEFLARTKPGCEGKVVEIDGRKYRLVAEQQG